MQIPGCSRARDSLWLLCSAPIFKSHLLALCVPKQPSGLTANTSFVHPGTKKWEHHGLEQLPHQTPNNVILWRMWEQDLSFISFSSTNFCLSVPYSGIPLLLAREPSYCQVPNFIKTCHSSITTELAFPDQWCHHFIFYPTPSSTQWTPHSTVLAWKHLSEQSEEPATSVNISVFSSLGET